MQKAFYRHFFGVVILGVFTLQIPGNVCSSMQVQLY